MTAFNHVASKLAGAVRQHVSLRHYQQKAETGVYVEWDCGKKNVLVVIPTGGGKTRLIASIISKHQGAACIFAHRQELVAQIAETLNQFGIPFRLIVDDKVRKMIIARLLRKHGVCFYNVNAPIGVASVNTLVNIPGSKHAARYANWLAQVTLWVCDEAHHSQGGGDESKKSRKENMWGKAASSKIFPNPLLLGLGVTATPKRGDGGGLSADTDGVFDAMVMGPTLLDLFDDGYLTPYDIYTVPCSVQYENIDIGSGGEFVKAKLVAAEDEAGLVGDIIENYLLYANGLKGVCFVSSVQRAMDVAQAFNLIGVPALALDGETDTAIRDSAAAKIESGELKMLVNCDLYGEGTDLPALEVVILGTGTNSLGRYMQRVGRLYRLLLAAGDWDGFDDLDSAGRRARIARGPKARGVLIDHGQNVIRFDGPPEAPHRVWTMGRYSKKSVAGETVPYRVCANPGLKLTNPEGSTWEAFRAVGWTNNSMLAQGHLTEIPLPCAKPYSRIFAACPHCGFFPEPISRTDPEHVEGDLELLDADKLAELYAQVRVATMTVEEHSLWMTRQRVPNIGRSKHAKAHVEKLLELDRLRHAMRYWGGHRKQQGDTDSQMQRRFFHLFGVDVVSAQTCDRAGAEALRERVLKSLDGIDIPEYIPTDLK